MLALYWKALTQSGESEGHREGKQEEGMQSLTLLAALYTAKGGNTHAYSLSTWDFFGMPGRRI